MMTRDADKKREQMLMFCITCIVYQVKKHVIKTTRDLSIVDMLMIF